jgi:hypothetical protein
LKHHSRIALQIARKVRPPDHASVAQGCLQALLGQGQLDGFQGPIRQLLRPELRGDCEQDGLTNASLSETWRCLPISGLGGGLISEAR